MKSRTQRIRPSGTLRYSRSIQRQAKSHADEDAHLLAGHRRGRAVVPSPAPADYRAPCELLDPSAKAAAGRHVVVDRGRARRRAQRRIERAEHEDGHLLAGDSTRRAIVAATAATDHPAARQVLDPPAEGIAGGRLILPPVKWHSKCQSRPLPTFRPTEILSATPFGAGHLHLDASR
jgi:hypothetical protein